MSYFTPLQKELMNLFRSNLGSSLLSVSITYPGVLADSTLPWKPHITEFSKKLAKSVGLFFKIRHYDTLQTSKLLYYSLFYCFISYCISVWGPTHLSVLDPLTPKEYNQSYSVQRSTYTQYTLQTSDTKVK